jgi:CheY-like chemotaxis protein
MTTGNVLVVDDEENNRLLLHEVLTYGGYEVRAAASCAEALAALSQFRPQAAIIDLSLEGEDGLTLIAKLRSRPELKNLAIVLYTATSETAALRDFMTAMRISHAILKPAEPQAILETLAAALAPV